MGKIKGWFKEILLIGKELGLVKLGTIYIDGTKIQANASRHKAMSYDYMKRMEEQLESEIASYWNWVLPRTRKKKTSNQKSLKNLDAAKTGSKRF